MFLGIWRWSAHRSADEFRLEHGIAMRTEDPGWEELGQSLKMHEKLIGGCTFRNDTKFLTLVLKTGRCFQAPERLIDVCVYTTWRDIANEVASSATQCINKERGEYAASVLLTGILILRRGRENRHALSQRGRQLTRWSPGDA